MKVEFYRSQVFTSFDNRLKNAIRFRPHVITTRMKVDQYNEIIPKMIIWVEKNIDAGLIDIPNSVRFIAFQDRLSSTKVHFCFRKKEDATAFKLKWEL